MAFSSLLIDLTYYGIIVLKKRITIIKRRYLMYCPYCHHKILTHPKYCPKCSYKLDYFNPFTDFQGADADLFSPDNVTLEELEKNRKLMYAGLIGAILLPLIPVLGFLLTLILNFFVMSKVYKMFTAMSHPEAKRIAIIRKYYAIFEVVMACAVFLLLKPSFLALALLCFIAFGYLLFVVYALFTWKSFKKLIEDLIARKENNDPNLADSDKFFIYNLH